MMGWGAPSEKAYADEPTPQTKADYTSLAEETFSYMDNLYKTGFPLLEMRHPYFR